MDRAPSVAAPEAKPREPLSSDGWDVIVVGAGVAGLSAAIEAERAGARVLVLEGQDTPGGRARWGQGVLWMAGTATQRARGVEDSPERAIADWPEVTGAPAGPWARRYLSEAPTEVHDWLYTLGVRFSVVVRDPRSGGLRLHKPQGGSAAVVRALLDALHTTPRTGTWVTGFAMEGDRVVGVTTRGSRARWELDGEEQTFRAEAIVVTSGSVLGARARIADFASRQDCVVRPTYQKRGQFPAGADMVTSLQGVDARFANLDAVGTYAHLLARAPYPFIAVERALWIAQDGAEFFDSTEWTSIDSGRALQRQPGCQGWAVFGTSEAGSVLHEVDRSVVAESTLGPGVLVQAPDARQLASLTGIDAQGLESTLAGARRSPLTPPLWAARLGLAVGKSFGGAVTDLDGRLLDTAGKPIPGLFAGGELCGMAGGSVAAPDGFDGSLGAVILSGRVAGRTAASASLRDQ